MKIKKMYMRIKNMRIKISIFKYSKWLCFGKFTFERCLNGYNFNSNVIYISKINISYTTKLKQFPKTIYVTYKTN